MDIHSTRGRGTYRQRKVAAALLLFLSYPLFGLWGTTPFLFDSASDRSSIQPFLGVSILDPEVERLPFPWLFLLISQPLFRELLKGFRRKRRFWAAIRSAGAWEGEFRHSFTLMEERGFEDWVDDQYHTLLRMDKVAFNKLHRRYGHRLRKANTRMRLSIPSEKRLAITLYWMAHGCSFQVLSLLFAIGKSTAVQIVHSTVRVLRKHMVKESIRFPEGRELEQVLIDFEDLSDLPQCAGAIDGTFMKIDKPVHHGDSYWCYKKYSAIIILAVVDARGMFTYVNAGRAGSAGDAATFHGSILKERIEQKRWLSGPSQMIGDISVMPYLVADSAFPLKGYMLKCFNAEHLTPAEENFNRMLIRARRVSEQSFGRLKGRFRVLIHNNLRDPLFAADVAIVACGLHNVCERWGCSYEKRWTIKKRLYQRFHPLPVVLAAVHDQGQEVRDAVAAYAWEE